MELLRWVLLLAGVVLIGAIFCYGRGWYPRLDFLRRKPSINNDSAVGLGGDGNDPDAGTAAQEPVTRKPARPTLAADSKVVAVRIMPRHGQSFPAEELVLALREAGLRHGQFGIFHAYADAAADQIRFSVASLVEPGSFDLSNLKDSEYRGVSMFAIFPAQEDGVQLFDDMVAKARAIAKALDGMLTDEQGGAYSLQRERYMREDLIDYLRRQEFAGEIHAQNDDE